MPGRGKQPLETVKNRIKLTRGVQVGTVLQCADNSGAKMLRVIGVKGFRGKLNRLPCATLGDVIVCSVIKGRPDMRKKIVLAVPVRQKQIIRRIDGLHVYFNDNAAVLITNKGELRGTQINGPVGREACDLWPKLSSQASSVF